MCTCIKEKRWLWNSGPRANLACSVLWCVCVCGLVPTHRHSYGGARSSLARLARRGIGPPRIIQTFTKLAFSVAILYYYKSASSYKHAHTQHTAIITGSSGLIYQWFNPFWGTLPQSFAWPHSAPPTYKPLAMPMFRLVIIHSTSELMPHPIRYILTNTVLPTQHQHTVVVQ